MSGRAQTWIGLLALCRVSNLPTVWMNVVTAVVLSGMPDPIPGTVLLVFSMSAFYTGGMALNDVFDAPADQLAQAYRPIPRGQVTLAQAKLVAAGLLVLGWGSLLAAPFPSSIVPGSALVAAIFIYDRYHKGHPWTVLLMAGCRMLVFVTSGWAMAGRIGPTILIAGALQFAYTLFVTVVARWEGRRGQSYSWPVVPYLLAGMCWVDGLVLASFAESFWLLPAVGAGILTRLSQRFLVRGD